MKRPRRILVGAVLAAGALTVAAPALADPSHLLRAEGPTNAHDASLAGVNIDVRVVNTGDGRTVVKLRAHGFPEAMQEQDARRARAHAPVRSRPARLGWALPEPERPGRYGVARAGDLARSRREPTRAGRCRTRTHRGRSRRVRAGSVVIHALPTNGDTGAAGPRLLCTNVPFGVETP